MSGSVNGADVDLTAVIGDDVDSGVAEGEALIAYTDAVLLGTDEDVERTRAALAPDVAVDAAAVMAMFTVMNRIADATGAPIDDTASRNARYRVGEQLGMTPH